MPNDTTKAAPDERAELKPCPFCGGNNLKSGGDDKIVGTWCLDCQCHGPNHYVTGQDWNTRTDLCLTQADLDAAVKAERARCGAIAESHNYGFQSTTDADIRASHIATEIRKGEPT